MAIDPITGAALVGGAATLAGGFMGQQSSKDALQAQKDMAYTNEKLQREFAQHGIRWKVEDAKAAGIHPLYALGANTASFTPGVLTGDTSNPMGNAIANMGQDISRAMMAKATQPEREMQALQLASAKADVEGKTLDNQIRAKTLSNMVGSSQLPPPMPSAHEGLGSRMGTNVKINPSQTTSTMPGMPSQEAAIIPDVRWVRTSSGALTAVPSKDIKESIEDNLIQESMWAIRNQAVPFFSLGTSGPKPPQNLLPKGYDYWEFSPMQNGYIPAKRNPSLKKAWDKHYRR